MFVLLMNLHYCLWNFKT